MRTHELDKFLEELSLSRIREGEGIHAEYFARSVPDIETGETVQLIESATYPYWPEMKAEADAVGLRFYCMGHRKNEEGIYYDIPFQYKWRFGNNTPGIQEMIKIYGIATRQFARYQRCYILGLPGADGRETISANQYSLEDMEKMKHEAEINLFSYGKSRSED